MKSMKKSKWIAAMGTMAALGLGSFVLADAGSARAKPPTQAEQEQHMKTEYVVANGDTLASIAVKVSGDEQNWVAIARANDLDGIGKSELLKAGTRLKIPAELSKS